ncbi:ribonuclease III [Kordiimonas aquimaris]|uniref:ribonuclease III n=1 Tax=Kordiimonas aquimaris TaxID=707591 RepID=UPI0021CFE253|nr:ribonuclease III [Kordiimonas aquimaris]
MERVAKSKPSRFIKKLAGYTFTQTSLLDEALTHPSLSGNYNYQRLEFLGDRVLGLVVSTWLLEEYPNEAEGRLNQRFTALVRRETLAEMSVKLGIVKALKLTPGAEQEGTRDKEAIQADVCESFIGALYLDGGFDAANVFIREHWKSLIGAGPSAFKDSKTILQEWCQARSIAVPNYNVIEQTGPDHNPVFTIEVSIDGHGTARASGSAKRIAEQAAAQELFDILTGEN